MTDLQKAQSERDRLDSVLSRQSSRIRQAFAVFLADTRSNQTLREVRQLLEENNVNAALGIVDDHVAQLANVIPRVIAETATDEVTAVNARLGSRLSRVSLTFNPTNERAAALMRASRLEFLTEFTNSQRAATRAALAEAARTGASTQETARAIRGSIGLTTTQMGMVDNYRNLLEAGSREVLNRNLRDRRFDPTVEAAVDGGEPLTGDQIELMTERYRNRMLSYRAENIARTESLRATSLARQEALQQIMEETGIGDDQIERTWNATRDKRTRDSHRAMNGQTVVGLDTPFETPDGDELLYPGDPAGPAAETINCRCVLTTRFLSEAA